MARLFAIGRTFSRLEKACALIGLDLKWRAKTVAIVRRGLSEAGDSLFPRKLAVAARQLVPIASQKGLHDEVTLTALPSWTFQLHVPVEQSLIGMALKWCARVVSS